MHAAFERARALAADTAGDAPIVVSVRAPAPRSWGAPLVVWEAGSEAFAGWGEATRLEATGVDRFREIRDAGASLLARVREVRADDGAGRPSPRLFGGFAFRPAARETSRWQGFADASFVLPAVRFATVDGRTWLSLALVAREAAIPGAFERAAAAALAIAEREAPPVKAPAAAIRWPEARAWTGAVNDALAGIEGHAFEKVVAATVCELLLDGAPSTRRALERLRAAYPTSTRFAFERAGKVFLGASPETLVSLLGGVARADALAGTIARADDDGGARATLLASEKDRREHAAVVTAVREALRPFARHVEASDTPGVRSLRNVLHLHTPVRADVDEGTHLIDIAKSLHPTPAVAGAPRDAALSWLEAHEGDARGWYAGAVGWFDARGEGVLQVAIRSGLLANDRALLFAGAGIVAGSNPDAEYLEVRAKLAPMLDAFDALEVSP